MMSGIRAKNTKPEIFICHALHTRGFRYRLHRKDLPGKPDIVLPRYNAVIFVNGCFWHGHGCRLFKWPKTRADFWHTKISGNKERDRSNTDALLAQGWRVFIVWECALKGVRSDARVVMLEDLFGWIKSDNHFDETPEQHLLARN